MSDESYNCLFFPDDGQSVAQGQDDLLHPVVVDKIVVEVFYTGRLAVARFGRFQHMAVPKRVVGQDESPGAQHAECHFIGFEIGALVAVDERMPCRMSPPAGEPR